MRSEGYGTWSVCRSVCLSVYIRSRTTSCGHRLNHVHVMSCIVYIVYNATVSEGYVITAFLLLMSINVLFAIIASAFIVLEVSRA